jgi:predicted enzyme related to lactoylglutathione lyase
LTVENAHQIRDFYAKVVGWKVHPVPMGDYDDYCMIPRDSDTPVAGICHARGKNAGLPPKWLIYITVDNLDEAVKACIDGGGKIITEPTKMEDGARFCAIEDPAGAAVSLYEKGNG